MMVPRRDHVVLSDKTQAGRPVTCEEFQSQLPELVGAGQDIRSHEHLKTCDRCAELLADLEYIAGIAGDLLLPVYEPGEAVWQKISASIAKPSDEAAKVNGHLKAVPR
jgi:hypothetical protein